MSLERRYYLFAKGNWQSSAHNHWWMLLAAPYPGVWRSKLWPVFATMDLQGYESLFSKGWRSGFCEVFITATVIDVLVSTAVPQARVGRTSCICCSYLSRGKHNLRSAALSVPLTMLGQIVKGHELPLSDLATMRLPWIGPCTAAPHKMYAERWMMRVVADASLFIC